MNSMLTAVHRRRSLHVLTVGFSFWLAIVIAGSAALGQRATKPVTKPAKPGAAPKTADTAKSKKSTPAAKSGAAAKPPADHGYAKLPADESQRQKRLDIGRMIRAGQFEAGQQEVFDTYYKSYIFPLWTDPQNYASDTVESRTGKQEAKVRQDVRKDLVNELRMARGQVHDHLAALSLASLTELAKGNYHPVVRFNAMLMIGDLNQEESIRTPTPYAPALPVLVEALKDPDQIDAVRVAALRGVVRHTILGIADPQVRDATVIPALIEAATTRVVPGRSADGQTWMRLLAIEALSNLRSAGPDGSVVQSLAGVIGENEARLIVRCAAAKALGLLDYQAGAPQLNPLQIATVLNELFLEVCTNSLDQYQEEDGDEPAPFRRRELKEQVYCLITALEGEGDDRKGIQGIATTDVQRTYITEMLERLRRVAELLDNKDLEDDTLAERLSEIVAELRQSPTAPADPGAEAAAPAAP